MDDKLYVVQFPHPGPEHRPHDEHGKPWNAGAHRRTFALNLGRYIDAENRVHEDELVFWCEWEPPAELVAEYAEPEYRGPRHLFRPHWYTPPTDQWLQNTDPFVFGECFRYSNCRQVKAGKPTRMQFLAPGSLILFGSSLGRQFVLDTVFVVARTISLDEVDDLRHPVQDAFSTITLDRIDRHSYRLYQGATFDNPFGDMYSFFPCLPHAGAPHGFARPVLSLSGIITDQLAMTFRAVEQPNVGSIKNIWEATIRQVRENNLQLGVATALPEHRDGER